MAYSTYELSTHAGKAIFLYRFVTPTGDYYFTNQPASITATINAIAYSFTPVYIHHSEPKLSGDSHAGTIELTIGKANPLANMHKAYPPQGDTWVTIFRKHKDDAEVIQFWLGKVIRLNWNNDTEVIIDAEPVTATLRNEGLTDTFQSPCNFFLYDGRCPVKAANWTKSVTVSAIADNVYTVTGITEIDGWFTAGVMEADNGDKRFILLHNTVSGAKKLTLNQAFPSTTVAVGDSVVLYAGCDRLYSTCVNKFGAETGEGAAFGGNNLQCSTNPHQIGRIG